MNNKKPLGITDVVLRDAHQSLFATRLRLDDMLPIAEKLDQKATADGENRVIIIECIVLIQGMTNPTLMWDRLEAYLPENLRHNAPGTEKGEEGDKKDG